MLYVGVSRCDVVVTTPVRVKVMTTPCCVFVQDTKEHVSKFIQNVFITTAISGAAGCRVWMPLSAQILRLRKCLQLDFLQYNSYSLFKIRLGHTYLSIISYLYRSKKQQIICYCRSSQSCVIP